VNAPLIVLTDPPVTPPDTRCPNCGAGATERMRSITYGPVHDVCRACGHDFDELTVPETADDPWAAFEA
jgi:uncharacterized protein (DUF983 family)